MACVRPTLAFAQPPADAWVARVVLWLPGELELHSRIRGQLSDLDVRIASHEAALPSDSTEQVDAAAALARASRSDAVIWFVADVEASTLDRDDPPGAYLLAWFADGSGVVRRHVSTTWDVATPEQHSAQLEIAALAARSIVRSLRPPPPPPATDESNESANARDAAKADAHPTASDARNDRSSASQSERLRWIVGANGSMLSDIPSSALRWGGGISAGARWQEWTAVLHAGATAPADVTVGGTDLTVSANPVDVEASYRLPLTSRLWLEPLIRAGASWILSRTTPPFSMAPSTPLRVDARFAAGAGARLDWNVIAEHFLHVAGVARWIVDPPSYDVPLGASANTSTYRIATFYAGVELGWRWVL